MNDSQGEIIQRLELPFVYLKMRAEREGVSWELSRAFFRAI